MYDHNSHTYIYIDIDIDIDIDIIKYHNCSPGPEYSHWWICLVRELMTSKREQHQVHRPEPSPTKVQHGRLNQQ